MTKTDQVVQSLHSWGRFTRAVEGVLVDNIAATAPWMTPIIPAWMAYQGMANHLGFPVPVGFMRALVVEFLGLSAITTTFQFWDWNDARRLKDQAAPVVLAAVTTAFYLVIIITVNVLLDRAETVHLIAKALLSCMSVISGLIIDLRS